MLNTEKQELLDNTSFAKAKKNQRAIKAYKRSKRRYFALSIFLSISIIALVYFVSSISNIKTIEVKGNVYLKDEDIVSLTGLDTKHKYLFVIPSVIEKKINSDPLIKASSVELKDDNTVEITIVEKKIIGYSYEQLDNVLILEDDSRIMLSRDNLYLIGKVPLILGFSKEDIIILEKNMASLDYKMINEISEMHYYKELKYQYVEIIMRDGSYVFTSPYGLGILNKYYDIKSSYGTNENSCFYFEDISGNAYVSNCPWDKPKLEENKQIDDKEIVE